MMADIKYDDSLIELYIFETTTLLDRFTAMLKNAKTDGSFSRADDTEIQSIMATIKGSSDMMRFDDIAFIAFEMEQLFAKVSAASLTEEAIGGLADGTIKVAQYIGNEIKKIEAGEPLTDGTDAAVAYIQNLVEYLEHEIRGEKNKEDLTTLSGVAKVDEGEPTPAPDNGDTGNEISSSDGDRYIVHVYFYEDSRMENVRAYLLTDKLEKVGRILASYPEDTENDSEAAENIRENGDYVARETKMFREQLEKLMKSALSVESVSFIGSMPNYDPDSVFSGDMEAPPDSPAERKSAPSAPIAAKKAPEPATETPVRISASESVSSVTILPEAVSETPDVVKCLHVSCGSELYSLLVSTVKEITAYENTADPYISLAEKLGIKNAADEISGCVMLTVSAEGSEESIRLRADDVIGTSDVKRLGLPKIFGAYGIEKLGVSACALHENGNISLILNPSTFLQGQKTL
jgi:chemotaxis protein histidine kinase CheA